MNCEYTLCLGSNLPPAHQRVGAGLDALAAHVTVLDSSGIYPSYSPDGGYENCVVRGSCAMGIDGLIGLVKGIECMAGRTHEDSAAGIVALDIDVVMRGTEVLRPEDFATPYFRKGYDLLTR